MLRDRDSPLRKCIFYDIQNARTMSDVFHFQQHTQPKPTATYLACIVIRFLHLNKILAHAFYRNNFVSE